MFTDIVRRSRRGLIGTEVPSSGDFVAGKEQRRRGQPGLGPDALPARGPDLPAAVLLAWQIISWRLRVCRRAPYSRNRATAGRLMTG